MSRRRTSRARTGQRGRPPAHEREARLAARRQELLAAAMAAIEIDGAGVSMTRMAAEAGVTKPVLYRYFGDRRGLYEAIGAAFASELLAELRAALGDGGDPRGLIEAGIDAYLKYVEEHRWIYRFLTERLPVETPDGAAAVSRFVDQVAGEIGTVLYAHLAPAGVEADAAELLAVGITGMVQVAGERWLEQATMARAEVVKTLASVLWSGLSGADADR